MRKMPATNLERELEREDSTPVTPAPAAFVTTQWTRVLEARGDSPEARAALSDLCAAYYAPVLAFIQRQTADEPSARDLTQEFFSRLLSRHGIEAVNPERGRFRSYLLGAVKNFLNDARAHDRRLKRGGGRPAEPMETGTDTSTALQLPDTRTPTPDQEYDRKWALTVLDRALTALAAEHCAEKNAHFETLKPWLTGDTENISQADAATRLGLNEGTVKVAIHRLRRRFRDVIRQEIGRTLGDPGQVEQEMQCLLQALS